MILQPSKSAQYVAYSIFKLLFVVCMVLCLTLSSTAFAVGDTFEIGTLVGDDTISPTIPDPLTATPVATSQINLAWGTSTDNFVLSGYHVYRDGLRIATTTATTYADVGLSASTTYVYYVTAYDSFFNISASSTVATGTTLASTTPPSEDDETATSTGTVYGSMAHPFDLMRFEVLPQRDSVIIRYETRGYVRSSIRWGNTTSYELGSLAERSFSTYHETKIVGLSPLTRYQFSIEGENYRGERKVLTESTFTTLAPLDVFAPGNVQGLTAVIQGDDIVLSWMNPQDPDLARVRVLRSERFYPSDLADGWVVFDDVGEHARDTGIARTASRVYYTVFTYDVLGNVSSGAVIALSMQKATGTDDVHNAPTTTIPIEHIDPTANEIALTSESVHIVQQGIVISPSDRGYVIDGAKEFTIRIPYDRVPMHLKTIVVTMVKMDGEEKEFSFLLRSNEVKTEYSALLAPLGVEGTYRVIVAVFDYTTAQIGYVEQTLISQFVADIPESLGIIERILTPIAFLFSPAGGYLVWFIALLLALLMLSRRLLHAQW